MAHMLFIDFLSTIYLNQNRFAFYVKFFDESTQISVTAMTFYANKIVRKLLVEITSDRTSNMAITKIINNKINLVEHEQCHKAVHLKQRCGKCR